MLQIRFIASVGLVLFLAAIGVAQQADASVGFRSARDLAQQCDPTGGIPGTHALNTGMADYWQAFCVNYVIGVADGMATSASPTVCFPESLSGDELKEVVLRYFRTHVEAVKAANAASVVRSAISSSYACRH